MSSHSYSHPKNSYNNISVLFQYNLSSIKENLITIIIYI